MVGRRQAQLVGEAQSTFAVEFKSVAVGYGAALATVAAWRGVAGVGVLAAATHIVTCTPGEKGDQ